MARSRRETWAQRVQRWVASDLTANEFASEIGVNPGTLKYWKWRLGKDRETKPSGRRTRPAKALPAPKFVEVTSALVTESPALELVVGERFVIRVPSGFDPEALRQLLTALEGRA